MFKEPFSFEGRIRRLEYGLSFIIRFVLTSIIGFLFHRGGEGGIIIFCVLYAPIYWFVLAQAVKRSHDIGNSGWWILVPFYGIWLLFADGDVGDNKYGEDPKRRENGFNQWQQPTPTPPRTRGGKDFGGKDDLYGKAK